MEEYARKRNAHAVVLNRVDFGKKRKCSGTRRPAGASQSLSRQPPNLRQPPGLRVGTTALRRPRGESGQFDEFGGRLHGWNVRRHFVLFFASFFASPRLFEWRD